MGPGLIACLALLAGTAQAQVAQPVQSVVSTPAPTSAYPQPVGIKLGEGRLHPYVSVESRYDSLVIGYPSPQGDLIFHFRPGLRFDLTTPSTLVAFNGSAEYLWYTGLMAASSGLSRFQADVGLDAQFNKDGAVEFQIGDALLRSDRTHNPAADVGIQSLYNDARLAIPIHPGGRALEITPKFSWQVELFDPLLPGISGIQPSQMNYNNLNFGLNAKWRFLPKTAIVLDGSFDWRMNTFVPAADRMVLRVQTGLVGLISARFSVTLLAGYGLGLSAPTATATAPVHNFIANAEVAYIPTDLSRVSVGYLRTMAPVPILGLFGDDRGYLAGRLGLMGGRLNLNGQLTADFFTFYAARNDFFLSGTAGPSFDIAPWFQVAASYTLGLRTSTVATVNFVRHEAMLTLTLRY